MSIICWTDLLNVKKFCIPKHYNCNDVLKVVTNVQITPSVVSLNEIKSVMNEIAWKIPIDLQLGFESDFDIWHVYKYSVTTLILHGDEMQFNNEDTPHWQGYLCILSQGLRHPSTFAWKCHY